VKKVVILKKESLTTIEARDEHIDVARADVLPVEFVTSSLDIVLRVKENETDA